MNLPLFVCSKCKSSERESLLLQIDIQMNNKEGNDKKEKIITPSDYSSLNNLEIIDYPYSINHNKDEKKINNESYLKVHGLLEENLDSCYAENKATLNSSSGIIRNEDSITQNKMMLNNLYNYYNNKNNTTNNNFNQNINEKKEKKNYNIKIVNKKKQRILNNIINYTKNKLNKKELNPIYAYCNTDRFSTNKKILFNSRILNTEKIMDGKSINSKNNFKKRKVITRNKSNKSKIKSNTVNNIKGNLHFKINEDEFPSQLEKNNEIRKLFKKKINKENINKIKINKNKKENLRSKKKKKYQIKKIMMSINNIKNNNYNNGENGLAKRKISKSINTSKISQLSFSTENHKQLILNRKNILNYNYKTSSYANKEEMNKRNSKLKKQKNNISSRIYINPFEKVENN